MPSGEERSYRQTITLGIQSKDTLLEQSHLHHTPLQDQSQIHIRASKVMITPHLQQTPKVIEAINIQL